MTLRTLLLTIWGGKATILLTVFAAVSAGYYYVNHIATPMYRSTAVVMLNNREEQVVDLGSVMGGLGSDSTVVNTEVEILKSRILLGKVVDELELIQDPEFNPALQPPGKLEKVKNYFKEVIGADAGDRTPDMVMQRQAAISTLLSRVSVQNIPKSLVFRVTVETSDRAKTAKISDTMVDLYILNQLEVKFQATEQATSWLSERVTDLQISLEESEEKVKDFRANTSLISTEALEALEIQVKEMKSRIATLEEAQGFLEGKLAKMEEAETPRELADVSEDVQLQRLLPRISDEGIKQSFEARVAQIVTRTKQDMARNSQQIQSLKASLEEREDQIDSQSDDLITLKQLTREAEASRLLYEYFLSRLKETAAQQGIQQADSRIISPAIIPASPASPRKSLVLIACAILGCSIGLIFVFLRENFNRTFRSSEEVEARTNYPVFGQIPIVPAKRRTDTIAYIKERPTSIVSEAIRNLRTSIMLSDIDSPPRVIMISSSLSGEGKTTVSLSLTLNFSTMGKRVLLIEGDIRRRVFKDYLGSKQEKGIVSVLSGAAKFEDVVVSSDLLGADVLVGEKSNANAADIFSSDKFSDLIAYLRDIYDIVIIDTPPVLIVPDARVIAQSVDASIFVVKWDTTLQEQVVGALREFESVGRPVDGVVLNQVNPKSVKRYGYGQNYSAYSDVGSKYYFN